MHLPSILEALEARFPAWLAQQRWFSTDEDPPRTARIVQHRVLRDAWPRLLWTLVEVDGGPIYQVPVGLRQVEHIGAVLLGYERARIGAFPSGDPDGGDGELIAYDALIDSVLGRVLFDVITDGEQSAKTMRPVGVEQSNTSVIFDNRLILKVFRRLHEGANPDLEVTRALTEVGFANVAPVVAAWEIDNLDLAVCQPYLFDGTEGWKSCLASVRDFLGANTQGASSSAGSSAAPLDTSDPAQAGGDFADESRRLGEVTAGMHLALVESFPSAPFDPARLADSLESGLDVVMDEQRPALRKLIESVRGLPADGTSAGIAARVHGDYHLGQTLRSVSGWYIFDFEGEPARTLEERAELTSPLKDVAGMVRSFHYAAATGLREQVSSDRPSMVRAAEAWEARNRQAFLDGYFETDGIERLLPPDDEVRRVVFEAFEVEKAIYELGYEKAYRPDWVVIPAGALQRLLVH